MRRDRVSHAAGLRNVALSPVKNAERILQGLPGWEPIVAPPLDREESGGVKADATSPEAGKSKGRLPKKSSPLPPRL
jgi:hypothetical protein